MTIANLILLSAFGSPGVTEIDFEGIEVTAALVRPATYVSERPALADGTCAGALAEGLPDLPAAGALGSAEGSRAVRRASRADWPDAEEEAIALAKAWTCFAWRDGARSTVGLYAALVDREAIGYCAARYASYRGPAEPDQTRTALDEATAEVAYCLVGGERAVRNPYERALTAISEAKLDRFLAGGAAEALFRRVERRVDTTPEAFLATLREIDASGAPAEAFLAGDSERVWTAGRLAREAADRLAE